MRRDATRGEDLRIAARDAAARGLVAIICAEPEIGLTTLYNKVDEGAYADLRALHERLDRAVAAAYGWPASAASDADDSNRRLLELNSQIVLGGVEYNPFSA